MRSTPVCKPLRQVEGGGEETETRSQARQPEQKSVVRSVYTNRDLLKHPTVRDFKIMPLGMSTPEELIPEVAGSLQGQMRPRGEKKTPTRAQSAHPKARSNGTQRKGYTQPRGGPKQDPSPNKSRSLLEGDEDEEFVNEKEFSAMRREAEILWEVSPFL